MASWAVYWQHIWSENSRSHTSTCQDFFLLESWKVKSERHLCFLLFARRYSEILLCLWYCWWSEVVHVHSMTLLSFVKICTWHHRLYQTKLYMDTPFFHINIFNLSWHHPILWWFYSGVIAKTALQQNGYWLSSENCTFNNDENDLCSCIYSIPWWY